MPVEKKHTEDMLDDALEQTFPASDALAIVTPHRRKGRDAPQDEDRDTHRAARDRSGPDADRR